MSNQVKINKLEISKLYSEELNIFLKENNDKELFKWFLASILFGARISETIAKNTYKTFERYELLSPEKILSEGSAYGMKSRLGFFSKSNYERRRLCPL